VTNAERFRWPAIAAVATIVVGKIFGLALLLPVNEVKRQQEHAQLLERLDADAVRNAAESKERLLRLARNLDGKILNQEVSTTQATWVYNMADMSRCWLLNKVKISEFTIRVSDDGKKITAEGQLPDGSCKQRDNNFDYKHRVGIPLEALPIDALSKKYGSNDSSLNPAELIKLSDWGKNAELRSLVSKKTGTNITIADATQLSENCTLPAQANLELKGFAPTT
jgi:hypothetical protein